MGKTVKGAPQLFDDRYQFKAHVKVHGKNPHTEKYSIPRADLRKAQQLGYLGEQSIYHDWKPLQTMKIDGGIYNIDHITSDDRYIYAHTSKSGPPAFSLPKYLRNSLPSEKQILVGRRDQ